MAGSRTAAFRSSRLRPEMQVNEKCRGSAVMSSEIAHKYVHYIMIKSQVGSHAYILL
jgi:hypothetical protein